MLQVLKFGGSSVANATNISRVLDIVSGALGKGRVVLVCSAIKGCTDALLEIAELAESQGVPGQARHEGWGTEPDGERSAQEEWGKEPGGERSAQEGWEKETGGERAAAGTAADTAALEFAEKVRDLKARHLAIIRRLFTGAERAGAEEECHALFAQMASAAPAEMVTFGEVFSTRIIARKLACDGVMTKWLDSRILVIKDHKDLTFNNIRTAVALEPTVDVFVAPGFIASTYDGARTTLGRGGSDLSASIYAAALNADSLQIWTDVPGIMTANPKDVPAAVTIPEISYGAALDMASHGAKVLYAPSVEPAMEAGIAIRILNTFDPENPGTTVRDAALTGWAGVASGRSGDLSLIRLVTEGPQDLDAACRRVERCLLKAGVRPLSCIPDGSGLDLTVRHAVERQALGAIHREFFETAPQSVVNLYVAGFGAVGSELVRMLSEGSVRGGKTLRLAGLANSSRYVLDPEGIDPAEAKERLAAGTPGSDFAARVCAAAPRRSVFLDLTDSEDIWREYRPLLLAGISIISSNRRSLAIPYADYSEIMAAAAENGCTVRYETTVGSGLPMLGSIAGSVGAGEEILSIEAVVSCTLNRILSSYARYPGSFAETVRRAQSEGLTEPDPRADLAGRDALRKLLILAREAGVPLEEEDVEIVPAVPQELMDLPLEEFYSRLEALEPEFDAAEKAAARSQCRQRYLATLEKDASRPLGYRASIGVRNVPRNHPAFRILGTENAIIIKSAYHPYPLVIQGAGEGARTAAAGVLNEILKI